MSDEKSLELAIAQLERQFGIGAVMRLGSSEVKQWPSVPTGAMSLDSILGIDGLPLGRIVEIYGPESSGKSTISLSLVAQAQKMGLKCAYIDAEHAFDPGYAKKIGVNLDNLLMSQPDTGEQALEITETLVKSNAIDVIVVDSVAALTPKAEIDGETRHDEGGKPDHVVSSTAAALLYSPATPHRRSRSREAALIIPSVWVNGWMFW